MANNQAAKGSGIIIKFLRGRRDYVKMLLERINATKASDLTPPTDYANTPAGMIHAKNEFVQLRKECGKEIIHENGAISFTHIGVDTSVTM